jgi:hypothetical protein
MNTDDSLIHGQKPNLNAIISEDKELMLQNLDFKKIK